MDRPQIDQSQGENRSSHIKSYYYLCVCEGPLNVCNWFFARQGQPPF